MHGDGKKNSIFLVRCNAEGITQKHQQAWDHDERADVLGGRDFTYACMYVAMAFLCVNLTTSTIN